MFSRMYSRYNTRLSKTTPSPSPLINKLLDLLKYNARVSAETNVDYTTIVGGLS